MAYVVKVKIQDVEKALAEVRPGHRLIQVCSYVGCPDDEYAAWEWEAKLAGPPAPGVFRIHDDPPAYQMRDLYFEEEPKAPKTPGLESMFRFDRHGNLCVTEAHL